MAITNLVDDTICIEFDPLETTGTYADFSGNAADLCYSNGHIYLDTDVCEDVGVLEATRLEEKLFIEFFHALTQSDSSKGGNKPVNPFDFLSGNCSKCHSDPDHQSPLYPEPIQPEEKPLWLEVQEKGILALEIATISGAATAVSPHLAGAMFVSAFLAVVSVGVSHYYQQDEIIDASLSFTGDISHATLKHITFYEIATCAKYKDWYRETITSSVSNVWGKYLLDIGYFMVGNSASNWIAYSLTDLYNKLIFDDEAAALRIDQEPFIYKGPKTAYKRFVKECMKDFVIYGPLKVCGAVDNFQEIMELRLNRVSESSDSEDSDDAALREALSLVRESAESVDNTEIPSLLAHFSANWQVSTWYNGLSWYNTGITLLESTAKYTPEIMMTLYQLYADSRDAANAVAADSVAAGIAAANAGAGEAGPNRSAKYFRIFMCTTTYNVVKLVARRWL